MVTADLAQRNSARTIAMGLLHAASRRGRFTSSLGGELLTGSLTPMRPASSLLGTSHGCCLVLFDDDIIIYEAMTVDVGFLCEVHTSLEVLPLEYQVSAVSSYQFLFAKMII